MPGLVLSQPRTGLVCRGKAVAATRYPPPWSPAHHLGGGALLPSLVLCHVPPLSGGPPVCLPLPADPAAWPRGSGEGNWSLQPQERPSLPLPPQPGAALRRWFCRAGYLGPGLGGCSEAWAQPCPLALQGPSVGPRGLRPSLPRALGTYWEGGWGVGGGGCSQLLLWSRSQRSVTWGWSPSLGVL